MWGAGICSRPVMGDAMNKNKLIPYMVIAAFFVLSAAVIVLRLAGGANKQPHKSADAVIRMEEGSERRNGYYESTLRLDGSYAESEVYHFAGNCIQIRIRDLTYADGSDVEDDFTIELYRIEEDGSNVQVEGVFQLLDREKMGDGMNIALGDWRDIPEGDYFFVYRQDADNRIINSDNVEMEGYTSY